MTIERNAEGCLLGLACGDALGRPVEFKSAEEIEFQHGEVTEMLGHGTHGQPPGTITDDTEMALRIAESLVDRRGFDPADVGDRFVDWLDSNPFDIGLMTRDSLSRFRQETPWDDAGVDVWESRPEKRIARDGRAAADAFVRAYAAFVGVRHPITQTDTETIGLKRMDPIAGATRVLVGTFSDAREVLLGNREVDGYDSPAEIEAGFDIAAVEELIVDHPQAIHEVVDVLPELASGMGAILDYITQLRLPTNQQTLTGTHPEDQLADLRGKAQTMVGELYVLYESLRRVAVRHPEIDHERWQGNDSVLGGD